MNAVPSTICSFQCDSLSVHVFRGQDELAAYTVAVVRSTLAEAIRRTGAAAAILATGNSQLRFLKLLVSAGGVDWSAVTLFHMDEYLGLKADHPACFRHYMKEKVETLVHPRVFHYLGGDADLPLDECARYTALLKAQPIDLCCLGIGENGHLAFNDPHVCRFNDPQWVKLVSLDVPCRLQQVKEGHFANLESVPPYAYTLTPPALMSARRVLCLAPESRKAIPVQTALEQPISEKCPASILRRYPQAELLLDLDSAARLHPTGAA